MKWVQRLQSHQCHDFLLGDKVGIPEDYRKEKLRVKWVVFHSFIHSFLLLCESVEWKRHSFIPFALYLRGSSPRKCDWHICTGPNVKLHTCCSEPWSEGEYCNVTDVPTSSWATNLESLGILGRRSCEWGGWFFIHSFVPAALWFRDIFMS